MKVHYCHYSRPLGQRLVHICVCLARVLMLMREYAMPYSSMEILWDLELFYGASMGILPKGMGNAISIIEGNPR